EYTVDVELSLMDLSYLEKIKDYFKKLSFPVSTNISNVEMTVSNINVTTVCLPSGENSSCCSCEDGYAWPSSECHHLMACPSASPAHNLPCGFMKEMPFSGPYCEPRTEDSCGMGKPSVMSMSVRLETHFWDDLRNSSSDLYRKFKADLEKAFNAGYRCLPGFVSATVTGFRPGSVFVNYEVKAGAANFHQIANSNKMVPQFVDGSYQINPTTFTTEVTDQTNFTVTHVDIFEGDTVELTCEINSTSENVTWHHFDEIISPGLPYLVEKRLSRRTSKSILKIINIKMKDAGSYRCTFSTSNRFHTLLYKATKTIAVSPLYITSNLNETNVICNSPEMQRNSPVLSCCVDKHLPSLAVEWKVSGAINITGKINSRFSSTNCTEYKLNISGSLCIAEQSGTVTTYTCELQTEHGATCSRDIRVTYYRAAQVTIPSSTKLLVSEGCGFNVTCESDMSDYESISWELQSGNTKIVIDSGARIKNSRFPATSVLEVNTATQDWNGTYICTFSQKFSNSSANVTIEVIPLPLQEQIVINPIEASIQCKMPQTLECCVDANTTKDYSVIFVVQQKECKAGKNQKGEYFCYVCNYTETECDKDNLTAYCKFINRLGQEVKSDNISLNVIPDQEASCSDNFGIGREGSTIKKPCCEFLNTTGVCTEGNRIYKCCNKSWKPEKDYCVSVSVNRLLTSAQVTFMSFLEVVGGPQAKAMLPDYLKELMKNTKKELSDTSSSSANLAAIVKILDKISSIPAEANESIIQNFLSTVDLVVADSTTKAWDDLNKEMKTKSSSLLKSVENFSLHLQPVNNNIPHVLANSLQLQGIVVTENSSTDYYKNFSSTENLTATVLISENEIQTLTQNSTIVSVMYSNLGRILLGNKDEHVNGLVISTTVSSNRSQKFNISMTFAKKNLSLTNPQCVFWNFSLNGGGWDPHGCTPRDLNDSADSVICSCNHLTSFSMLMSEQRSSEKSETYITYICLGISVLSLVTCIIIESLVWKHVTNNTTSYMRHVCILNIAISLLIANVWFLVTDYIKTTNQQMSRDFCLVATFFIHLFYLCVFFWMLSLGLILFYRLVFILHNTSKTAQKALAFCLGYGCPFVIAVITITVTLPRNSYTTDSCWLKWDESKTILAFVIPALMIVATNFFITTVVIIKILRPTIGDNSSKQERNSLFQIGKSVAILTPLLGLTWGLGLVTMIENSHPAFHILFALLNGLQGLFILVFGTLWDKKILEALLKKNSISKWSSQQTKSSSLILVTPMLAMSYPFSRTFNNLCGKTG
ncbi:putative G-protein coupled receptor 116, partial [Chaetura pelagica]